MLADRLAARTVAAGRERGLEVVAQTIELRALANEIAAALVTQNLGPGLTAAVEPLAGADGIVAATPIYKAGVSGLFKGFFDVLDNDLLIAKPVAPIATAGTARHALVVDESMRPLFAYMRALTIPTSVFAATEDWAEGGLDAAPRPRRPRADPPHGERLRRRGPLGLLGQLPTRIRQRRRHRTGDRPRLRPDAPRHRRLPTAVG